MTGVLLSLEVIRFLDGDYILFVRPPSVRVTCRFVLLRPRWCVKAHRLFVNQTLGKYRHVIIIPCTQRRLADLQRVCLCILLFEEQHRFDPRGGDGMRDHNMNRLFTKRRERVTDIFGQIDSTIGYKVMNSVLYTHRLFLKAIFVLVCEWVFECLVYYYVTVSRWNRFF